MKNKRGFVVGRNLVPSFPGFVACQFNEERTNAQFFASFSWRSSAAADADASLDGVCAVPGELSGGGEWWSV